MAASALHYQKQFRAGTLESPALFIYKRQERLHNFMREREHFDLQKLMKWRGAQWLQLQTRTTRPPRAQSGSPLRQLEQDFLVREGFSLSFRALGYARAHDAYPF